jgi:hypothetical protein
MYSYIPLTKHFSPFGDHQRFNRLAYKQLRKILPDDFFPDIKSILHYEGKRGPDGTKFGDESCVPDDFINPADALESSMMDRVMEHYQLLVDALKSHDKDQSSYQAAWLAHTLVDGLTPAHHIPYNEMLTELAEHHKNRSSIGRMYIKGDSTRDTISRTNKLMGPKGMLMKHTLFEFGAALSMQFFQARNVQILRGAGSRVSLPQFYAKAVGRVAKLNMYSRFEQTGFSLPLVVDSRRTLGPTMVEVVSTFWYHASQEALR